jgi:acyl-CoA synthetase (AMP-forming)/AMP-acid ligase II
MPRVGEIPELGARHAPHHAAIIAPELGARWTYSQLNHRVGRALAILKEFGLKPGDRFAYLGKNSDHFPIALFAAIRGGYVLVALNWRSAVAEIAYFLGDSHPRLIFCDPAFRPLIDAALIAETPLPPVINTEADASIPDAPSLRVMLDAQGPVATSAERDHDLICLLLYTSGTTGRPKGAMISHRMLTVCRQVEFSAAEFPPSSDDRTLITVPTFHIGGITMILISLIRFATCILTSDSSARNAIALCKEYEVTLTWLVPTLIRQFVDEVKARSIALPQFRTMMYGGAPIPPALLREAAETLQCQFSNSYGTTEINSATLLPPSDHRSADRGVIRSVGRPLPGISIDIRDSQGVSLPTGTAGEVWIATPTIMSGYWNRPAETANAVVQGWYRTGDGGHMDDDGYLYLTDRMDDMIISGGENVYPVEVENVLRQHPAVFDAAVVGAPDKRWGQAVTAVVECRPEHSISESELIGFAREQLAGYKCPKTVLFASSLPRTASGKVKRGEVRKKLTECASSSDA